MIEKINASDSSLSVKNTKKPIVFEPVKSPETKKDGKKKLAMGLAGLAIAGAATVGMSMAAKNKRVDVGNDKYLKELRQSVEELGSQIQSLKAWAKDSFKGDLWKL
ncbi:MAG: hypothetical protein LUH05_02430 [Candidatus Gastranaerophilales bacterium]|nr:hypothetical protein [Candidatus Gastranaerophilales bacterium]